MTDMQVCVYSRVLRLSKTSCDLAVLALVTDTSVFRRYGQSFVLSKYRTEQVIVFGC